MTTKPKGDRKAPAAWAAARTLSELPPNMPRRKGGASQALAWMGIVLFVSGLVGSLAANFLLEPRWGGWSGFVIGPLAVGSALGLLLLTWAAPRSYVSVISSVVRATETIIRRSVLAFSVVGSLIALLLVASANAGSSVSSWWLVLAISIAIASTGAAAWTLKLGVALVSATSTIDGYFGRRWALLIASIGVMASGICAGALGARALGAPAVFPSVALAVLGIVIGIFTQQHRDLHASIDALERALSALHHELVAADIDETRVRAAATQVESAMMTRTRGPISLAPVPLVDDDLVTCLYYLLPRVTGLPFRIASEAEVGQLGRHLDRHDPRLLLAELAWEVRRRILRPAKAVEFFDERAHAFDVYPQLAAPVSHRKPSNERTLSQPQGSTHLSPN